MGAKRQQSQERYLKLPNHILNTAGLAKGPKLLLAHIYSFGRKGCWQSNETLGKMFFVCARTISLWIGKLKEAQLILWLHPKGYYRTLWAVSHPDVQAATALPYRGKDIPKSSIISGQIGSGPLRKNFPSQCARTCAPTAQEHGIALRNSLPPTNNTTPRKTSLKTSATPSPLPAGGQAPALLRDRKSAAVAQVERFAGGFGGPGGRRDSASAEERAGRAAAERELARIEACLKAGR